VYACWAAVEDVVAVLRSWRTEVSWSLLLVIKASWEQGHRDVLPEVCPHEKEKFVSII